MNEKLSNISKMFDKVLKDCVTSNIKITLYFDHNFSVLNDDKK